MRPRAQPQKRVIDGVEYEVFPLPGGEASEFLNRLMRIVAPGAAIAAAKLGFGGVEEDALGTGLTGILDRFPIAEQRAFQQAFARTTFVDIGDDKKPKLDTIFDLHFQGDMGAWAEWFVFCLEVNFAGFFRVLAAKIAVAVAAAKAKAEAASKSKSPPAATGASGG
jgi:hypothetical protein